MSILFITHDLGVVAEMCDDVAVMYLGKIVEQASADDIFYKPLHPYTKGLLRAIPSAASSHREELYEIHGTVPSLLDLPTGCQFNTRCPKVEDICRRKEPELRAIEPGHNVACWKVDHA